MLDWHHALYAILWYTSTENIRSESCSSVATMSFLLEDDAVDDHLLHMIIAYSNIASMCSSSPCSYSLKFDFLNK